MQAILQHFSFFIYDGSLFYRFNGIFYESLIDLALKSYVLRSMPSSSPDSISKFVSYSKLYHYKVIAWNPSSLMNFNNGVLNLITGELNAHSSNFYFLYTHETNYTLPHTKPTLTLEFLSSCVNGDKDRLLLLLSLMYCILTNTTRYELYLELIGSGGTGKSSFIDLLRAMIHPSQATPTELAQLSTNRFEGMNISGKKLIYVADSEHYSGKLGRRQHQA